MFKIEKTLEGPEEEEELITSDDIEKIPSDDSQSTGRSQAIKFFRDAAKYGWGEGNTVDPSDPRMIRQIENEKKQLDTKSPNQIVLEGFLEEIDSAVLQLGEGALIDLEECRVTARQLLEDVYETAKKYVASIRKVEQVMAVDSFNSYDYQQSVEESDRWRRAAHDALIAKINIAILYIKTHLKGISNPQGFLPDSVDINDRHSITDWAIELVEGLEYRTREATDVDTYY